MKSFIYEEFDVRSHLNAYWLRPESALWDCIAARNLRTILNEKNDIVEVGIGNGFFSFLMFGGRFSPEFDWFFNVNTKGFWNNNDIFDNDSGIDIASFIIKFPNIRLSIGLDWKLTLLKQAAQLGFVEELIQHDCNNPLPINTKHRTVYSNMLYWLNDPINAMHDIAKILDVGGELITVFPNSNFYKNCLSYTREDPLWMMLNRGRASHIMWHMDLDEFENIIHNAGIFQLEVANKYLAPSILKIWDIGLRPISVPLIKMANEHSPEVRLQIKEEWNTTLEKFMLPLLLDEIENGNKEGGYNLVVLKKK